MKWSLIATLLFVLNVYAVEAVQDGNCSGSECQKKQEQSVQNSTTTVNEDGLVSVADTKVSSTQDEKPCVVPKESSEDKSNQNILKPHRTIVISVVGQGVAPVNTTSPAQAFALAKRAAIADAYRLIAEKVKGVEIEGEDLIKNMMVKRSSVRTSVYAMIKNANVVETTFRDGLCEVEMEIRLSYEDIMR